jgi:hypothetical protein
MPHRQKDHIVCEVRARKVERILTVKHIETFAGKLLTCTANLRRQLRMTLINGNCLCEVVRIRIVPYD